MPAVHVNNLDPTGWLDMEWWRQEDLMES